MIIDTKNCRSCGKLLKTDDVHEFQFRKNPNPLSLCSDCNTAFSFAEEFIKRKFEKGNK